MMNNKDLIEKKLLGTDTEDGITCEIWGYRKNGVCYVEDVINKRTEDCKHLSTTESKEADGELPINDTTADFRYKKGWNESKEQFLPKTNDNRIDEYEMAKNLYFDYVKEDKSNQSFVERLSEKREESPTTTYEGE